jgi:hypothetical protein
VIAAMRGKVIEEAELMGTYAKAGQKAAWNRGLRQHSNLSGLSRIHSPEGWRPGRDGSGWIHCGAEPAIARLARNTGFHQRPEYPSADSRNNQEHRGNALRIRSWVKARAVMPSWLLRTLIKG